MISLVRVDDRLVHGQITVGWVPYLRATQILVVNDRLAADSVLTGIVRLGGTAGLKIEVVGTDRAALLCRQGAFDCERLIVLFENLEDARRALDSGLHFRNLNLGGLRRDGGKVSMKGAVSLSPADLEVLRDLRRRGIEVEVRLMPGDRSRLIPAGI
jgi:mannose/fructose/N-acetylgalactosamine-specific phosphotransferase system component IIB